MRIYTKHIEVLGLTPNELDKLLAMVDEAKRGQTVHYAEREMSPGQFFGISINISHEYTPHPPIRTA